MADKKITNKNLEDKTRKFYSQLAQDGCHSAPHTYVKFCSHYRGPICKNNCEYAKERNKYK